uniref:Uncharacterized protein n=1 Tax=Anguilla anguilla TaxID=7936 RepID=A0A0E9SCT0_ANGAN
MCPYEFLTDVQAKMSVRVPSDRIRQADNSAS